MIKNRGLFMLLSDAFQLFIEDKYVYAAADTVRYYKDSLSGFINWLHDLGINDTQQLNQDLLKQYAVYLRDLRKIKNTSIHTYFRGIKNFSLFCIDHHFCEYFNYKIRLPRPDPDFVLPLSSAEVDLILRYIDDYIPFDFKVKDLLVIRFMLDMGLRRSEVINLKLDHIDFDKKLLRIVNSKYNKSRILPIPKSVMCLIYSYFRTFSLQASALTDPFFSVSSSSMESFFARMKRSTGIQRLHPHLLRHTFATSYMLQRGNLEYLRIYLGHSSYDVTKRYIHLSSELIICSYDCYRIDPVFK